MDEKLLIEAAKKEGFELESKVNEIFRSNGLTSQQNFQGVDVFAYPSSVNSVHSIFIVQCKGSSQEKILLLFAKSQIFIEGQQKTFSGKSYRQLPELRFTKDVGFNYITPNPAIDKIVMISTDNFPIAMRYAYTGDFRSPSSGNKLPRQDEKNNFYKGITQICSGVVALEKEIITLVSKNPCDQMNVVPLIVTNAQIYIKENGEDKLVKSDWAICECDHANAQINPAGIPYVFVVNANKLSDFIDKFG